MIRNISSRTLLFIVVSAITLLLQISCGNKQPEKQADQVTRASEGRANDSMVIELIGRDSITVFDLLKQTHLVDSWSTAAGVFVNGIDSLKNSSRVFWIYSVNDTMPQIAGDRCYTRNGDKVKWHFRKMP